MKFDFFMPTKLITGENCIIQNSYLLKPFGKRCFIVTSGSAAKKSGALADIETALKNEGISYIIHDTVAQNPLLTDAYEAGRRAKAENAEFIIGIGGGSPLDASKAVAAYAANDIELMDVYGELAHRPLPIVAVGTTAGTGSEVTPYAVMTIPDGTKRSIVKESIYPALSFGDAKYTATLPLSFTVSTALDALAHALEAYFNTTANSLTDLFAIEGMRVLVPALKELTQLTETDPISTDLRDRLYYASILCGVALAECGTAYCHALGYFLSEQHGYPHGIACAVYLPGFIRRQAGYLPAKSALLEAAIELAMEPLAELVKTLHGEISVTATLEELQAIAKKYENSANFNKTAPSGLSAEEATSILVSLYR